MRAIPLAVPLAWTKAGVIRLQGGKFACETDGDCRRFRRLFR
jgi:hypothetical protein